jgi:hypothetical protein
MFIDIHIGEYLILVRGASQAGSDIKSLEDILMHLLKTTGLPIPWRTYLYNIHRWPHCSFFRRLRATAESFQNKDACVVVPG